MARILILGVNGQDGSYLAQHLCPDHEVMGIGQSGLNSCLETYNLNYVQQDIKDIKALSKILNNFNPEYIFHMAAVTRPATFCYEAVLDSAIAVNITSIYPILEYCKQYPKTKMVYSSSSKVFKPLQGTITEDSPKEATCLYSTTKLAAEAIIKHYRKKFGVQANIVYLFNHESERRPSGYFFSNLVKGIYHRLINCQHTFKLHTLDFYCDWGSAEEYMKIVSHMLFNAPCQDYILATGKTVYAYDLIQRICKIFSIETDCIKILQEPKTKPTLYTADIKLLKSFSTVTPQIEAFELCHSLIIKELNRENHVRL